MVPAMTLAATFMPLSPIEVPPQATACQLWPGVPGAQVAVRIPTVGTFQLTSPTSVEPAPSRGGLGLNAGTRAAISGAGALPSNVRPIAAANSRSAAS